MRCMHYPVSIQTELVRFMEMLRVPGRNVSLLTAGKGKECPHHPVSKMSKDLLQPGWWVPPLGFCTPGLLVPKVPLNL